MYNMFMKKNGKRDVCIAAALIYFTVYTAVFAEKNKDGGKTLRYRGKRLPSVVELFYVTKIESEIESADYLEIKIKFNIPADPRTLQKNLIRINGKLLPAASLLFFNKAGNKIRIMIPVSFIFEMPDGKKRPFHIDLTEARSFNHIPLYSSHFGDIRCNKEYKFEFSNTQLRKPLKEKHGKIIPASYGEYLRFEEDD